MSDKMIQLFHGIPALTIWGCVIIASGAALLSLSGPLRSRANILRAARSPEKRTIAKRWNRLFWVALALGSMGTFVGSFVTARDSIVAGRRIAEALDRMNAIVQESPQNALATESLEKTKDEFEAWADNFVSKQPLIRQSVPSQRLTARSREEVIASRWQPIIQNALDCLKRAAEAYNNKEKGRIALKLKDCPTNFCVNVITELGSIDFGNGVRWILQVYTPYPLNPDSALEFRIKFECPEKSSPHGRGTLFVALYNDTGEFRFDKSLLYDLPHEIKVPEGKIAMQKFDTTFRPVALELLGAAVLFRD